MEYKNTKRCRGRLTIGNIFTLVAIAVTAAGLYLGYSYFTTKRCDTAVSDALNFHTKERFSKLKSVEETLLSKFSHAASVCGSNKTLWSVLDDWNTIPGRCSGEKPRGEATCDGTIAVLRLLKE